MEKVCVVTGASRGIGAAVAEAMASLGTLEIVVNNAGISESGMLQDITPAQWHRVFSVNARGTALVCREAAKSMIARKYGRIINISSMWGVRGASCESVYSASPEEMDELIRETPLGRIGLPEDIALAACFLSEASFITGQVLTVDGGFTL